MYIELLGRASQACEHSCCSWSSWQLRLALSQALRSVPLGWRLRSRYFCDLAAREECVQFDQLEGVLAPAVRFSQETETNRCGDVMLMLGIVSSAPGERVGSRPTPTRQTHRHESISALQPPMLPTAFLKTGMPSTTTKHHADGTSYSV